MKMYHPDSRGVADVVSKEVFEAAWKPRGWALLAEPESFATEALGRGIMDLDDATVEDLKILLAMRTQDYRSDDKKDDLKHAYLASFDLTSPAEQEGEPAGEPETETKTPTASRGGQSNKRNK